MRCSAAIAITAAVLLTLIAGLVVAGVVTGGVVAGKEQASGGSGNKGHLLVRPSDVAAFGDVEVAVPEGSVEDSEAIDPLPLTNWEGGRLAVLIITSPESGQFAALIHSSSFKFSSPQAAHTALDALPDPIKDYSWESVVEDNVSMLDDALVESLEGRSWRVWHGIDNEGVPAYVLWIQSDSYVTEVYLNVLQEPFGRQLFNHIVRLVSGKLGK